MSSHRTLPPPRPHHQTPRPRAVTAVTRTPPVTRMTRPAAPGLQVHTSPTLSTLESIPLYTDLQ